MEGGAVAAPVLLQEMVACVDREISMRQQSYPRWVAQRKLTQGTADKEIWRMRAVRAALIRGDALQRVLDALEGEKEIDLVPRVARMIEQLSARFPVPA